MTFKCDRIGIRRWRHKRRGPVALHVVMILAALLSLVSISAFGEDASDALKLARRAVFDSERAAEGYEGLLREHRLGEARSMLNDVLAKIADGPSNLRPVAAAVVYELAYEYANGNDYAASLELCARALSLAKTAPSTERLQIGILSKQAELLGRLKQHDQAVPVLHELSGLMRGFFGENDLRTIDIVGLYAASLSATGHPGHAVKEYQWLIPRYVKALGQEDPRVLDAQFALARDLLRLSPRSDDGIALLNQNYQDSRDIFGASSPRTIARGMQLEMHLAIVGRTDEALTISDEVLRNANRANLSKVDAKYLFEFRAYVLSDVGRYSEALTTLNSGLSAFGGDRSPEARTLTADLLRAKCDISVRARLADLNICLQAMAAEEAVLPPRPINVVVLNEQLALAAQGSSQWALAAKIVEPVLSSLPTGDEFQSQKPYLQGILAKSYLNLGRYPEAMLLAESAKNASLAKLGSKSKEYLGAVWLQAVILRRTGDDAGHRALLERDARDLEHDHTSESLDLRDELSQAYLAQGEMSKALELAQSILQDSYKYFGDLTNPSTRTAARRVVLLSMQGNRAISTEVYELASTVYEGDKKDYGELNESTLRSEIVLQFAALAAGKGREHIAALARSLDHIEQWRDATPLLSDERMELWRSFVHQFYLAAALPDPQPPSSAFRELLFVVSERAKTSARFESLALEKTLARIDPKDPVAREVADLRHQIAALDDQVLATQSVEDRVRLYGQRSELENQYSRNAAIVLTRLPQQEIGAIRGVVKPRDLASLLESDEVYLSYLFTEGYGNVFAISNDGQVNRYRIDAGPPLARSIEAAAEYVASAARGTSRELWRLPDGSFRFTIRSEPQGWVRVEDPRELFAYLGKWLFDPVKPALGSRSRLVISPDSMLWRLPFDLLESDGHRLIERFEIVYTPNAPMLQLLRRQRRAADAANAWALDLIAFGAPAFSLSPQVSHPSTAKSSDPPLEGPERGATFPGDVIRVQADPKTLRLQWGPLPGTEEEIRRDSANFEGRRTLAFKGEEASEDALRRINKSGVLRSSKYLVFATHGYINDQDPRLTSIVLAGANDEHTKDGYLTAQEIVGLTLGSNLVVLSACETAKGRYQIGEGMATLALAVVLAGGGESLVTLWPIVDDTTADFMAFFFSKLKEGVRESQALTLAKRRFLNNPKTSAPLYWAAFTLIGG